MKAEAAVYDFSNMSDWPLAEGKLSIFGKAGAVTFPSGVVHVSMWKTEITLYRLFSCLFYKAVSVKMTFCCILSQV